MKKTNGEFFQGAQTIMICFMAIFAGMALKLEKSAQPFHVLVHVHPCYPLQKTTGNSFNV